MNLNNTNRQGLSTTNKFIFHTSQFKLKRHMNSIFLKTLKGEKTERPPVWFMRQAGRVLPSYNKLKENHTFWEMMQTPELAAQVTLLPINDLGTDAAILFSDILVIPNALGMELNFANDGPKFPKPLKDLEDPLSHLKPDPSKLEYIYAAIDEILKTRNPDTPLIGFSGAPFTVMCYMIQGLSRNQAFPDAIEFLYKEKETAKKIIDLIVDLTIVYAEKQIEHGIDTFQLFDTHAGLIPVNLYKELFFPAVKRIAKAVKDMNIPFIYFPKDLGVGLADVTPDMADFVSIDWQMPIEKARELVHPEIGLQGNLDPRILFADQKTIETELEKYLEFGKNNQDWIFNLGHGFLPGIPFENAKFLTDWVKNADWGR